MKKTSIRIAALLCTFFALVSCEDNMNYESEFETSYRAWQDFKAACGNSYRYEVAIDSWVGSTSRTVITVTDGTVTQRSWKHQYEDIEEEWTENAAEIGTHDYAAEPRTLDEVYDKARNEWLIKRENTQVFFETGDNGMIFLCGYVDDRCADDCLQGITITRIESL
jgi:hypothetical protein